MALIHVNFFSETLGMSSQLEVVLPQRAAGQIGVGQAEESREIPVLYLLHGMTDNHTTWGRNTCIERYASELGFAVVMPNGHLGWYTDMKNGYDYYTYIAHEVPAVCERFFPRLSRRREGRFVAGNSMGGYGAVKLALSRPDFFCAAASLSGGLDVTDTAAGRAASARTSGKTSSARRTRWRAAKTICLPSPKKSRGRAVCRTRRSSGSGAVRRIFSIIRTRKCATI